MKIWSVPCVVAMLLPSADLSAALGSEDSPKAPRPSGVLESFEVPKGFKHVVLPLTLKGETHLFVLDTGTTSLVFGSSLKPLLGAPRGKVLAKTPASKIEVELFEAPEAFVGKLPVKRDQPVGCADAERLQPVFGKGVVGILGMSFLKDYVVQLDFDRATMSFLDPESVQASQLGTSHLMLLHDEKLPYVMGRVADESMPFLVDTGWDDTGCIATYRFETLHRSKGLAVVGTSIQVTAGGGVLTAEGRVDRFALGPFEHEGLVFHNSKGSRLGIGYLSRYLVTFDFPNQKLYLKKSERFGEPDPCSIESLGGKLTFGEREARREVVQIDLSSSRVTNASLARLRGLTGLRSLDLKGTEVGDGGLEHVEGLSRLMALSLTETQVTDAGLERLQGLTGLMFLDLRDTAVGNAGLEHLVGLARLRMLILTGTQVTDAGLEHVKRLTGLEALFLVNTPVSDAGLEHLKGSTGLGALALEGTQITDAGLEHLGGLTDLELLDLSRTQVTDAGLEHLKQLTGLRILALRETRISDGGLRCLKGLADLKEVHIWKTKATDEGVKELQGALPNCKICRSHDAYQWNLPPRK